MCRVWTVDLEFSPLDFPRKAPRDRAQGFASRAQVGRQDRLFTMYCEGCTAVASPPRAHAALQQRRVFQSAGGVDWHVEIIT